VVHDGDRQVLNIVTSAHAQEEPHGEPAAVDAHDASETHATTEAHGGEHGDAFPPFDPATFGSQLIWLAITFGLLFFLMKRVALPRIGAILENRSNRIAGDLAEAGRLKEETDAAIAAYEQALAAARQSAHSIGQEARDAAKAGIDADRKRIEADLQGRLDAADARIAEVKNRALAQVDAIARDAADAIIETLSGTRAGGAEIAGAVEAAMAERT
jgi:F-type H+-transporting ATPase subunit b